MSNCTFLYIVRRAWLLLLLLLQPGFRAPAQSTRGIDFWTGCMFNVSTLGVPATFSIYVTARSNTTGVVTIPQIGWTQNFGVPANSGTLIQLPSNLIMSYGSEGIENKGVHIVTSDTVDIFAMSYSPQTVDATLIFSVDALGTDYRVLGYSGTESEFGPVPSECLIVATENATQIEITPSSTTIAAHAANVPFTITLDAGQVYQVQAANDLTGSRVRSLNDKRFALYGGAVRAKIPAGNLYTDHVVEQIYPIDHWGQSFVAVPLMTRTSDTYRVVAANDNTTVTINGANPFTLNAGQFNEFMLSKASVIASDKPISVAQYSNSSQFDMVTNADPFMIVLNPTDFMRRELRFFSFAEPTIYWHYVNIVTLTNAVNSVRLDGTPIGAQFQPLTTDPFYSWAQVPVTSGEHELTSFWGSIAYVYGYGLYESYGYSTGAEKLLPCPSPSITALGDTVFCDGGNVVLDAGPGYDIYQWSDSSATRTINVTKPGVYYVVTLDSNGCDRPSRPVTVSVHPIPQAAITVSRPTTLCPCDSATLVAPAGYRYRWTTGDTSRSITVRTAGNYGVTIIDTFGCSGDAVPVVITVDDGAATIALGSRDANPGERVTIPLYIVNAGNVRSCGLSDYVADIRFDRSLLHLDSISGGAVTVDSTGPGGAIRRIEVKGRRAGDTLARLMFTAALGSTDSAALQLVSFRWEDCSIVRTDTVGGQFHLTGICRVGGPRLVAFTGGTVLKPSRPNPAGDVTTIDYELGEMGRFDLYLTDLFGKRVATFAHGDAAPGSYRATADVAGLVPGTYTCVLETASERATMMIRVVR